VHACVSACVGVLVHGKPFVIIINILATATLMGLLLYSSMGLLVCSSMWNEEVLKGI